MTATNSKRGSSQCDRILARLRTGGWVGAWDLHMTSGSIAVHSRIAELRGRGLGIENMTVRDAEGIKRSYYRIVE